MNTNYNDLNKIREEVTGLFEDYSYENLIRTMGIYSKYSHNNCRYILSQNPDAKCVATFNEWHKLHRHVKAGAQAIYIWAPNDYCRGYHRVPVFDIDQTEAA